MSIEVTIRPISPPPAPPAPPRSYPWLGTDGQRVVLFSSEGCGTIIRNVSNKGIGHFFTTWQMTPFREVPADEEVVIRTTH